MSSVVLEITDVWSHKHNMDMANSQCQRLLTLLRAGPRESEVMLEKEMK